MDLAPDFNAFIECLIEKRVEFLIVGAYAVAIHGVPRFTGDLDVLVAPTPQNAQRLIHAIRAFGFPVDQLHPEEVMEERRIIEMGVEPVQIHIMSAISGVTWDSAWADRVVTRIGSLDVAFLGKATLLQNKRAAGRPKDLADIDALSGPVTPDESL